MASRSPRRVYLAARARKRLFGRIFGSMLSDNAFALRRCVRDILGAEHVSVTARECTLMLTACSTFKDGNTARNVLATYEARYAADTLPWRPNVRHFTATIAACARGGELGDGLALLRRMEADAQGAPRPNTATYNALLFGCRLAGRPTLARGLVRRMRRMRIVPDARTCTALLTTMGDASQGAAAIAIFDEILTTHGAAIAPSVLLYNAAIGSCAKARLPRTRNRGHGWDERSVAARAKEELVGARLMLGVATQLLGQLCAAAHSTPRGAASRDARRIAASCAASALAGSGAPLLGASTEDRAAAAFKADARAALNNQPPADLDYYTQRLSSAEVEHELHVRGLSTIGNRRELAERLRAQRRDAFGYERSEVSFCMYRDSHVMRIFFFFSQLDSLPLT